MNPVYHLMAAMFILARICTPEGSFNITRTLTMRYSSSEDLTGKREKQKQSLADLVVQQDHSFRVMESCLHLSNVYEQNQFSISATWTLVKSGRYMTSLARTSRKHGRYLGSIPASPGHLMTKTL